MVANLFTIMVLLLGVSTLLQIKRDVFPEVDFGRVVVTTRYPGASPEDVELNVTNEIEEELKAVSGIDEITSYSMEGLSIITVEIDIDTENKDEIRDDIREAVNRVTDLPQEVTEAPRINEINSEIFPVIQVGVSGDVPYRELREYARLFKKKLEDVSGVSRVQEIWYLDREVKIQVKPDLIDSLQLPLEQVANAIRMRNIRATGGSFESYSSEKSLVTLAQFEDPEDVKDVVVRSTFNGPLILVKDIAIVERGFEEPNVIARMNGEPAITFTVLKKQEADVIRTVDAIKKLVESSRELTPDGIQLSLADDMSFYLRNRFSVVQSNGLIGLALVLIILSIFLNLRIAFWVAVSIPVVLLGVIFLLPITGAYLDIIALAAMIQVIGIIVDDGIIVGENIVRRREKGDSPVDAATNGLYEVARPVLTTILTTFLAFAPMFFMSGVFGEFVVSIPLVISLAVFVSLFELIIALPAHLVSGLKKIKSGKERKKSWFDKIRDAFRKYFVYVLKVRYLFILFSVLLFAGTLFYAYKNMRFVLFPSGAADTFFVYVELPVGSSMQKTLDKTKELEEIINEIPEGELSSFTTRIGSHGDRQPGEYEHWAMIKINLTPFAKRERTANEIVNELRPKADSLSGFKDITFNVESGGPPVGEPINIKIVGADDEKRRELTDSVTAFLADIEGVKDIDRNDKFGKEQVKLNIDYNRLARLGLTVADVARTVRIAYDGEIVTDIRSKDEDVEFRVMFPDYAREDLRYLESLLVPNNQNRLIRLGEIANLEMGPGPSNYFHYDRERTTVVTADLDKGKTTPVMVTDSVVNNYDLDKDWSGMRFVVGGEAEETEESFRSLGIAFVIAIIGIYFLLTLLFNSATQPLIVMVAIPFGVIAVIIAFALHGEPPGFLAMMGLVGLTGVVVNDSLIMVDRINNLRKQKTDKSFNEIVAEGASDRLRAIIMTTLTTVAGLIPLAYGIGGSDPFIAPMALALGYGLLFAMPLTLVLVPCLYSVRVDIFRLIAKIFGRESEA